MPKGTLPYHVADEIWPAISAWEYVEDLIFMQDSTPTHFSVVVRERLNAYFPWDMDGLL